MGPGSSIEERSVVLATLPGKGLVRMCQPGCIHLTYGCVTLDFHRAENFAQLVEVVRAHGEPDQPAQVQYGHAFLRFSPDQFLEFSALVAVASEHLEQVTVVRRLLSEFPTD